MELSIELAPKHAQGLLLANPVMTASGTFGYGVEYGQLVDIQRLGAIVCKGTTLKPRAGNPQPRLIETPFGLINSIGLQNIGVEAVIENKAPLWAGWKVPVIVNIAGETIEEYGEVASRLKGVPEIRGIEVNISCPNVAAGGLEFGTDPKLAAKVTGAVKAKTNLPVIVKLSPNVTDIVEIAQAVTEAGADALCLINTVRGMVVDRTAQKPALGNIIGGLSGPAIKPIALYMVYRVARAVEVPVIGCGGIVAGEDAIEFLMAGASAVQVGTATFANPNAAIDVLDGIITYMKSQGVNRVTDLIGVAKG